MPDLAQPAASHQRQSLRRSRRPSPALIGVIAGLATLTLYAATCARGPEWQDSGLHQLRIVVGQIENPMGLALSHPLHYYLGRAMLALPFGDPLFKLNLLSGICGAIGVGVLAGLVVALTRSRLAAGLAAAALAFAHSYWQMSATTETYTLAAALMTIEWACLLKFARSRRPIWLAAVFAVNGLHVADHLLGLLTLATYGVLLIERIARRRVAPVWLPLAIGIWVVTASPYWSLVLQRCMQGGDLGAILHSAIFGGRIGRTGWSAQVLNTGLSASQLKLAVLTFGYCFPSAAPWLALLGVLRRARGRMRVFRRVLLVQTVIIFIFVGRYTIPDLYTFFVPVCTVTALWFGLGAASLLRRCRSRRARGWLATLLLVNAALPLTVYLVFPALARERGWLERRLREIPFRDAYAYHFQPWRFQDDSARQLAREVLSQAGEDGWVIAGGGVAPAVTLTFLLDGGPPGAQVFWYDACQTDPGRPPITPDDVRAHIEHGHRVLLVPAFGFDHLIPEQARIDKSGIFWEVELP